MNEISSLDQTRGAASSARLEYRELLRLSAPIATGAAASTISRFVDLAMMGRSSVTGLAGVSASMGVQAFFASIVVAAASAHQILAARRFGAGRPEGVASALLQSFVFAGSVAVVCAAIIAVAPAQLVGLIAHSPAVVHEGVRYLLARVPGLLLAVPTTLLIVTLNSARETRWGLYAGVVTAVTNIALDFPLIFGWGRVPAMGALGNALSSTISEAIGLVFLIVAIRRGGLFRRLGVTRFAFAKRDFRLIVDLNLPAMTSMALDYSGSAVLLSFIALLGASALATGRLALTLLQFFFIVIASFGTAAQLLAARAWGAHDASAMLRYRRRTIELTMMIGGFVCIPLWIWPQSVARLFTAFPAIVESAATPLRVVGLSVPLLVWAYGNVALLRATGRVKADMVGNIISIWVVQLPAAYCFGIVWGWGLSGIMLGTAAYWLSRAVLTQLLQSPSIGRWQMKPSVAA